MAIKKRERVPTREELLAEIRRHARPRSFEEMLGPKPQPGDADDDLEGFLEFLEEQRRVPARYPGDEEPG